MGQSLSSLCDFGETERRILMVGLDGSGKTTILNRIRGGATFHDVETTNGFNLETVDVNGATLTIWDIGGKCLPLYYHYYQDAHAFVFVIDSSDEMRMKQVSMELTHVLKASRVNRPVLILANKQELPMAMPATKVREQLTQALPELLREPDRQWIVQGTSGANGSGLDVGMDWLVNALGN
ncbi:ADP-ribosylation factor family-domain-containing protein [Catenaria anguillulae PL171]|uniref:ADP-ribosylation factor family-domain-containing protein n=1 Tax=Catenaria anguillulae PL171 TaxID=765915 RepID=A0A1Y2HST3_9FUNG|nr:ADP-ribosylation factor family-domain-containing protein [Catenaria anguillulae PL171]